MELIGGKVKLRPADDSDFEDFYNWWNDPEFAGEFADDFPKTRDEVKKLLKNSCSFVIEGRTDGRKIGFISYYSVRSDYLNLYEIGYRVKPSERRKGYTTEAARGGRRLLPQPCLRTCLRPACRRAGLSGREVLSRVGARSQRIQS